KVTDLWHAQDAYEGLPDRERTPCRWSPSREAFFSNLKRPFEPGEMRSTMVDSEGVCCVMSPDPSLVARLEQHGQEHLLAWWSHLSKDEKARLQEETAAIDFDLLDRLTAELVHGDASAAVEPDRVGPIEAIRLPQTDGERVNRRRAFEAGAET